MKQFYKTVAVVTIFSVCEKFLGFLYRIFLSRTIGAEGVGVYQIALTLFALLLTACCSGTPITVSRLMTKYSAEGRKDKVDKVITAGVLITVLIAVPLMILPFIFRNSLSLIFADERCTEIFLVVLPALLFTSVYSVLRGVFWGNKDFLSYSVIELLEEICMIVVGVILISNMKNLYRGAFYAGVAVAVSYLFSFLLATTVFFIKKNKLIKCKSELKPLISSAAPVTAMRTANSLIGSLVSVVLPLRLIAVGFSSAEAVAAYGSALGQAMPILCIPSTLTGSFTLVLVPFLSENFYSRRDEALKKDVEKAIKFTVMISCAFIPAFFVCGEEIGVIIFNNAASGNYLAASAFLVFLMGTSNITTSMLNSFGLENKTLFYYIIGAAFMLLSVLVLPKYMGIYSLLVGLTCVYGLTTALNLIQLDKSCKIKPHYAKFTISAAAFTIPACIFGVMAERLLLPLLGSVFTLIAAGGLATAFYLAEYFALGLVSVSAVKFRLKAS